MTGTPPRRQTGDRICPVKHLPRVKRTAGLKPPRTRSPWFRHDQLADARRSAQPTSERAKPVEPDRDEEAARVETTPHPKTRTHPSSPNTHKRFRHDPLADARRTAQPTSGRTKPVEPDRDEEAARVETTPHPKTRTRPSSPNTHKRFRHDRLADARRTAQPTSGKAKPVEPGRDEEAARVETTPHPKARTRPSSPDTHKRFRHDPLANARRPAQPTSGRTKLVEPGREERAPRVETTGGQTTNPAPVVFRPW